NAELKRQKHDPTELLAQGGDQFRHEFVLEPNQVSPPIREITIFGSWDDLFMTLFWEGLALPNALSVIGKLGTFLRRKTREEWPEAEEWLGEAQLGHFGTEECLAFKNLARVQLQGLGFINANTLPNGEERWELTEKGKLHCAFLAGQRRN